jgi:hypothetical protein
MFILLNSLDVSWSKSDYRVAKREIEQDGTMRRWNFCVCFGASLFGVVARVVYRDNLSSILVGLSRNEPHASILVVKPIHRNSGRSSQRAGHSAIEILGDR